MAKKTAPAAAKAPRVPAPAAKAAAKKTPADMAAAVSASWADPAVRASRIERVAVKVGADVYSSIPHAFRELKLPMGRMVPFRKVVKAEGRAVFETDKGAKLTFIAVDLVD